MCAIPAATGLVMMAELVTQEFKGKPNSQVNLSDIYDTNTNSFSTEMIPYEDQPSFQLYNTWYVAEDGIRAHDPFVDVQDEPEKANGEKWISADNFVDASFEARVIRNSNARKSGYITWNLLGYMQTDGSVDPTLADEGDTIGCLLDITVQSRGPKNVTRTEIIRNIPVSFTHYIEEK